MASIKPQRSADVTRDTNRFPIPLTLQSMVCGTIFVENWEPSKTAKLISTLKFRATFNGMTLWFPVDAKKGRICREVYFHNGCLLNSGHVQPEEVVQGQR